MRSWFEEQLPNATGRSRFVVAVFLDVRGFSRFAGLAESVEAAFFLKKMYQRILERYFSEPDFVKPTGDGLMLLYSYEEDTLGDTVKMAVSQSCRLVDSFATLLADEPMLNFEVPHLLGIGIARGAATELVVDDSSLDYSGRPLNLAARLMDLARPQGVVFDKAIGVDLVDPANLTRFTEAQVYLRGIAELEPHAVFSLTGSTVLPDSAFQPIGRYVWFNEKPDKLTLAQVRTRGKRWHHALSHMPVLAQGIQALVTTPARTASGRKSQGAAQSRWPFPLEYLDDGGNNMAILNYELVTTVLEGYGVKANSPVSVAIRYKIPEKATG